MPKTQETVLEINLSALGLNFNYLKSKLHKTTRFMAVVKAFAYGSEAVRVAKHLEQLGVNYFAVAYVYEGIALRNAGIKTPILVLHPQPVNFKALINYRLEPSLYNAYSLTHFLATAKTEKVLQYPVHIKFNTGLNRIGFLADDIPFIAKELSQTSTLKVISLFSHLAASEDPNEAKFTNNQIEAFKTIVKEFKTITASNPFVHICNTSGILNYPEAHFDMVRSGIGLYGYGNSEKYAKHLKPISTLKTVISQIHEVHPGNSVGYNRAFFSKSTTKVATLPLGHADGLSRIYGNGKGGVYINSQFAPIIGNVCMDMVMVDVTGINCNTGDEVIVFNNDVTASELAKRAQTISYELLTAISPRIKRVFIP